MSLPRVLRKPLVLLGVVVVVAGVAASRPRVLEVDQSLVVVDGRGEAWTPTEDGPGLVRIAGTLRLVGGRCVGLERADGSGDAVVVWEPGTRASSTGVELEIETRETTFVLGDRLEAGTVPGRDLRELADALPPECGGRPIVDLHDPTRGRG